LTFSNRLEIITREFVSLILGILRGSTMYTIEQKKDIILAAIDNNLVNGMEINPSRKGADVSKLKKGKKVAGVTIERLWSNLNTKLDASKIEALASVEKFPLEKKSDSRLETKLDKGLENRLGNESDIAELRNEIALLRQEVTGLKSEVSDLREKLENKPALAQKEKSVLGWTLQQKKGFWYAAKNINGKVQWVYVGKDASQADCKIKAWLVEHTI
jgi:hypothetical protein